MLHSQEHTVAVIDHFGLADSLPPCRNALKLRTSPRQTALQRHMHRMLRQQLLRRPCCKVNSATGVLQPAADCSGVESFWPCTFTPSPATKNALKLGTSPRQVACNRNKESQQASDRKLKELLPWIASVKISMDQPKLNPDDAELLQQI